MKRNRSLAEIFDTLHIENKKPKNNEIVVYKRHNDIFNIGQIKLNKFFYTKDEVIDLINERELTLYDKFRIFMKNNIYSIYDLTNIIPRWVK